MAKTIAALYEKMATAEQVVAALIDAGFSPDDISLLVRGGSSHLKNSLYREVRAPEGAGFGALIGALVGVGAFLLPGVGLLIGAGPLALAVSAAIGAAAGAVTGGLTAVLLDLGMGDAEANFFAEGIRQGGTLVSLTTRVQWLEWAENIMKRYQPLSLEEHFSGLSEQQMTAFAPSKSSGENRNANRSHPRSGKSGRPLPNA